MINNLTNPIDILQRAKKLEKKTRYPENVIVKRMIVVIEKDNVDTLHILKPHNLTMQHMWYNGFDMEINFEGQGGRIEKTILQAAPVGSFQGNIIGRYVFRVVNAKDNKPLDAKIIRFAYRKQTLK